MMLVNYLSRLRCSVLRRSRGQNLNSPGRFRIIVIRLSPLRMVPRVMLMMNKRFSLKLWRWIFAFSVS